MVKTEFKQFCKADFESRGFKKIKNSFYLTGPDLLCEIYLQKSNYGNIYYVNFCYYIGNFNGLSNYPTRYESDIQGRITVMSKTQTYQGEYFITSQIEYEEYSEEDLCQFFDKEFKEKILPPIIKGKKFILKNLNKLYFLTLNQEEVLNKLKL